MLDIVEDSDTFFVCALFYVDYLINSQLGHYDQCQFAPEDDTNLHESQAAASRSGTFAKNEIFVFFLKVEENAHIVLYLMLQSHLIVGYGWFRVRVDTNRPWQDFHCFDDFPC